MGMCDDLIVEYDLPVDGLPKKGWQTKSFDCKHALFTLTKEGRLLERVPGIELHENKVRETGEWKTSDRNFEGKFNFYQMIEKKWHEFDVVMIDGEVKMICVKRENECE